MGGDFGRAVTAVGTMGGSEVWRAAGDIKDAITAVPQVQGQTATEEQLKKDKKKIGASTATVGGLLGTEYVAPQQGTTFGN